MLSDKFIHIYICIKQTHLIIIDQDNNQIKYINHVNSLFNDNEIIQIHDDIIIIKNVYNSFYSPNKVTGNHRG
jgi:hypothetical protein